MKAQSKQPERAASIPASTPASGIDAPLELVIPDCCNIGIMVRALLFVNGAVLAAMLISAASLQAG
ncbi:MAG TPA: hypothetical protein VI140_04585, partial [Oxalicibacterium sp.]